MLIVTATFDGEVLAVICNERERREGETLDSFSERGPISN
jgi:hypothetical protein